MHVITLAAWRDADLGMHEHDYTERDIALYALGVGCNASDLRHVYERHPNFAALPTFALASVLPSTWLVPLADILPRYDPKRLLHGEQFLQVLGPTPVRGGLRHRPRLLHVADKGKAAAVVSAIETTTADGQPVCRSESTQFIVGSGGFEVSDAEGAAARQPAATCSNAPPRRPPDAVLSEVTSPDQAALYRLSGDPNPIHIDPEVAGSVGFERPILHGLCTLGIVARRLLLEFGDDALLQLRTLKVRFAGYVLPGETLRTEVWQEGGAGSGSGSTKAADISNDVTQASDGRTLKLVFRTFVVERNTLALSHAAMELGPPLLGQPSKL